MLIGAEHAVVVRPASP